MTAESLLIRAIQGDLRLPQRCPKTIAAWRKLLPNREKSLPPIKRNSLSTRKEASRPSNCWAKNSTSPVDNLRVHEEEHDSLLYDRRSLCGSSGCRTAPLAVGRRLKGNRRAAKGANRITKPLRRRRRCRPMRRKEKINLITALPRGGPATSAASSPAFRRRYSEETVHLRSPPPSVAKPATLGSLSDRL